MVEVEIKGKFLIKCYDLDFECKLFTSTDCYSSNAFAMNHICCNGKRCKIKPFHAWDKAYSVSYKMLVKHFMIETRELFSNVYFTCYYVNLVFRRIFGSGIKKQRKDVYERAVANSETRNLGANYIKYSTFSRCYLE